MMSVHWPDPLEASSRPIQDCAEWRRGKLENDIRQG